MHLREHRADWHTRLLVFAVAAAAGLSLSCRDEGSRARPSDMAIVVVSGDTAGWIVPCGCTTHQSGGLLRRGTYLRSLQAQGKVVALDAGGAPGGDSAYQRVKFEAILSGEKLTGLAAHNIGGPEVVLGIEYLREAALKTGVRFISANLRRLSGEPAFEPATVLHAAGLRLAVIGVLSPRYATSSVRIDEPKTAILSALRQLESGHDHVIVLAYLPEDEMQRLAAELPEVDAIIGGPTGQAVPPRVVGPVTVASATNKGKFLVQLDLASGQKTISRSRVVELTGDYTDDAQQTENYRHYLSLLGEKDFTSDQAGLVPPLPEDTPAEYRIAGSDACRECHARDDELWQASRHAKAWEDLAKMERHVDPYCQQCHSTGYGLPGGFVSAGRSHDRLGVGCESCHGPSMAHVNDPDSKTPFDAKDQCIRCHDRENSPRFSYEPFWEKVKHGESPGLRLEKPAATAAVRNAQQ